MTREELLHLLELNFEKCSANVYAEWLDDNDNRKEPTTFRAMLKRLGLQDLSNKLVEAESLGLLTWNIDDRALNVTVNK